MVRALVFLAVAFAAPRPLLAQAQSVLHIKIVLADADRKTTPVPGHALLISDNPATSLPSRVVTSADGTAEIRLRPGNYTVESDRPTVVDGRAYQWTQIVDIVAGRDVTLELTSANAEVGPVTAETQASPAVPERFSAVSLFAKWENSVVALWTEHRHTAGFMVSGKGLVATSLSGIGDAKVVEVQLSPTDKVSGRVLATDVPHDIAVVQINPAASTSQPVALACGTDAAASVTTQDVLTFEVPFLGAKDWVVGALGAVNPQGIEPNVEVAASSAGAPVFADDGPAVGLISLPEIDDATGHGEARVVRAPAICALVAAAEQKLGAPAPPSAAHLPVESSKLLPTTEIQSAAAARGFSLSSYASSSSEFDILFITPMLIAGAESQRERTGAGNDPLSGWRAVTDFGEWLPYVSAAPPVLFIRVSPKLAESFWMKFARGAASTQGASIPPITHLGPGFSRMRVMCGSQEIAPVHPFKIRARVSETDAVDEGFYAFDPMAIGPQCGTVSLVVSSVKDPEKTETRVIDPAVIAQVWKDFAAYRDRAQKSRSATAGSTCAARRAGPYAAATADTSTATATAACVDGSAGDNW